MSDQPTVFVDTRRTDERFTIRYLVDMRGSSLTLSLFKDSIVTPEDVTRVYVGLPVKPDVWKALQKVLRERMTRD